VPVGTHRDKASPLVDVLCGPGCRIGELLALDWTEVGDKAGTLAIEGTVIAAPGKA
jgi:integrase